MMAKETTTVYKVRDRRGRVIAEHVRTDRPDGGKDVKWRRPDGQWGLNGTPLEDLPLYGSEDVDTYSEFEVVVVAEGEKATDALRAAGIAAVGTVTGASQTPTIKALEVLEGLRVCLFPDNDPEGRAHMDRIGARLQDIAAEVLIFEWPDAPEKGDAADHPDPAALEVALETAPRWEPPKALNPLLKDRVLMGALIDGGIEPPEELEPEILLKGRSHVIVSPAEVGKTWLVLWLVARRIARGEPVILFDEENGREQIGERLELLGVDTRALDEHLYYISNPVMGMSREELNNYRELIRDVEPAMVVFDSWIGFLADAGLDESSNTDVQRWCKAYVDTAKEAGAAVVILDHVPHEGERSRGAGRKRDMADVQWCLKREKPFGRETIGELVLKLGKSRDGVLPRKVTFSVGGSAGGFIFARSSGTVEEEGEDGLTANTRLALDVLEGHYRERGATFTEWMQTTGIPKTTFRRTISALLDKDRVEKTGQRYYPKPPVEGPRGDGPKNGPTSGATAPSAGPGPNAQSPCKTEGPQGPRPLSGPNGPGSEGPRGPHPFRGGPDGPCPALTVQEVSKEMQRSGSGPAKALAHYLDGPTPERLGQLTRAVLYAHRMPTEGWERYAVVVEEAARTPGDGFGVVFGDGG